jgi:holin-like protein
MALFLLPALISVLLYRDLFMQYYIALISAVLLSTIVSLVITLWLSQRILSGVKTVEQETTSIAIKRKDNDQ